MQKWILGERTPDTPKQAKGKEVHDILEEYMNTGVIPQTHPLGYFRYIEWIRDHPKTTLPDPNKENVQAEFQLFLDTANGDAIAGYDEAEGVPLVGFIDVGMYERPMFELGDLKTTTDLKWAKTPSELYEDTQMNTYAKWAFSVDDELEEIKVTHYYVKVGPPGKQAVKKPKSTKVLEVSTEITRESAEEIWQRDLALMEEMKVAALVKDFKDLPPNLNRCPKYSGCEYKGNCGIKPSQLLFKDNKKKKKADKNMGNFLSKVKAAKKAADGGEDTESPKEEPKAKAKTRKVTKKVTARKKREEEEEVEVKKTSKKKTSSKKLSFAERRALAKGTSVPPKEEEEEEEEEAVEEAESEVLESSEEDEATIVPPDGADRETSEEESEEIRAKASGALEKKKKAAAKKKAPTRKSKKRELVIYVGCMPSKGSDAGFVLIEDWAGPILDKLNSEVFEATEQMDYRLLGYGEEKVALSEAINTATKSEEHPLPPVLVSIAGGVGKEIASLLYPLATDVVVAIK